MSGKKVFGLILLLVGASALLGLLGIHIGGIVALAIGVILVGYGFKQWKEGRPIWAAILLFLGIMVLLGSLPMVFTLLVGVLLVYFGYRLFTNEANSPPDAPHTVPPYPHGDLDNPFDDEWEKIMKSSK